MELLRYVSVMVAIGGTLRFGMADSLTLEPVADNTLIEDPLGSVSNGAGTAMQAGLNGASLIRRAVLRFDVEGAIPTGARITQAALTLENTSGTVGSATCGLYRVTASWGEGASFGAGGQGQGAASQSGDATWIHRIWPDVMWATPGGEYATIQSASMVVNANGSYTWSSVQLARDVQSFLDAPARNYGWLIKGDEVLTRSVKRFSTREESNSGIRPRLKIDFDRCPSDLNGDVAVDDSDFALFVTAYNLLDCADPAMAPGCPADLNTDGAVNDLDFVVFVAAYSELICG